MEEFESSPISSGSPYSSSTHTEALTEFSIFIDKLDPIMSQMTDITDSPAVQKAIDSLQADYIRAKALVNSQSSQSPPTKHIEHLVQNLGRSLGLVFFAGREVPLKNREKIEALCKEMMNVRFEFDEIEYETEEKTQVLTTVISQVKGGDGEAFKNAVLRLSEFVLDATVSDQTLVHEDVIRILTSRLGSCRGGQERVIIVKTLRYLLLQDNGHKENMKDLEFLSTLVKLLTRDVEERREAVGLLLSLSDENGVMRQIGRIKGCILMLVAIANGDDEEASRDAKMLLRNMSGNTQHALHMAEAAYFKPLINYLKEGSEMSKVLMATALSRLQLTEQNKSSLGQQGAIEPLVQMFQRGSLEAKLSALNALQSLSDSSHNTKHLIDSNILVPLLQLLFSVTSVQMTLREPASAILAKIAKSESILVNKIDVAHQMLSLLNVSTPAIQQNLLEALYNIVSHSGAVKVRRKMKENGAIKLLLQFFKERDVRIRTGALKLVHVLSKDILIQELDYANVSVVANIASTSGSEIEMAEALGILSNLPMSDKKVTEILKKEKLVPLMVSKMSSIQINSTLTSTTVCLAESIAGLMLRFTDPNDKSLQHFVAENGIIDVLIKSLSCSSESIIISKVALCLAQMSRNTLHLSNSRKAKWFCMQPTMDASCEVHKGFCSVKGTFCLVKAQAVGPLVGILVGSERGADEAVLSCLSTLLVDEIWESGSRFLEKMSGVCAVIKVLRCGSFKARERALWILERVFRVEDYRIEYGKCAQVVLIDLAQNGDAMLAPAVAKVLAQLELLQEQSTYF